jgi:hypothetical protein
MLGKVFDAAGQLFGALQAGEDDLTWREIALQDKRRIASTAEWAENNHVIAFDDENAPPELVAYAQEYALENELEVDAVPTHKVINGYIDQLQRTSQEAAYEQIRGSEQRANYIQAMTATTVEAQVNATATASKQRMAENKARADTLYQEFVDAGDLQGALAQAEANLNDIRAWTPEEHAREVAELPGKIDFVNYSRALQTDNAALLDSLQAQIWREGDNRMTNEQRWQMSNAYDSKILRLTQKAEADYKRTVAENSANTRVDLISGMMEEGRPLSWQELAERTNNLDPSDRSMVYTFANNLREKRADTSDPATVTQLQGMALNLAMPSTTDINQRRAVVQLSIAQALADSKISDNDARTLMSSVDTMESIPYNTEAYKRAQDRLYTLLVGGSKAQIQVFDEGSPNLINALNAEEELIEAMREGGPAFNPEQWVKDNIGRYASVTLEENRTSADAQRFERFEVYTPGVVGINLEETLRNVKEAYKNGAITKEDADQAAAHFRLIDGQYKATQK